MSRCIPYRLKEEEKQEDDGDKSCSGSCMDEMMEVLLISSQKGGEEIMFPKVHSPQNKNYSFVAYGYVFGRALK